MGMIKNNTSLSYKNGEKFGLSHAANISNETCREKIYYIIFSLSRHVRKVRIKDRK